MSHVFIVGFMGAGKSTVGPLVADRLGLPFVDLDHRVAGLVGRPVREIFAELGEEAFRALEHDALEEVIKGEDSVVACGGGIVTRPENASALASAGSVVYLRTTAGDAVSRIRDLSSRPLLAGEDPVEVASRLLAERSALYEAVADVSVDTAGRTPAQVADSVVAQLAERDVT